jgi:hypothetical protein
MELEVLEPSLFLDRIPAHAAMLVNAVCGSNFDGRSLQR